MFTPLNSQLFSQLLMQQRAKLLEDTGELTQPTFSSLESAPYLSRKAVKPYAQVQKMPSLLKPLSQEPINLKQF